MKIINSPDEKLPRKFGDSWPALDSRWKSLRFEVKLLQEMDHMEAIKKITNRLWNDEAGFIVSLELILIATIVVIGMITGLATVRNAVVQELSDVAGAVQDINQSYTFNSAAGPISNTAGSVFVDTMDSPSDGAGDPFAQSDNGIVFDGIPTAEVNF